MRFRALVVAVSLAGAVPLGRGLWQSAGAADPPVDAGLLEFLGSVGSDDEDWHQYLGSTGANAAVRRVHSDPVDPPANDRPAATAPPGGKASGSAGSRTDAAPAHDSAPGPTQPGDSSGPQGQSNPPPEVKQT